MLVNYPEGALLKEMTQNADDAGASTFKVVLDLRSHDSRSLSFPGTAEFQGPALLTYNDAVFTDTDLESIQNVGASRKTEAEARAKSAIESGALRDHGRHNFASQAVEADDPFEGMSPEEIEKLASMQEELERKRL